MPRQGRNESGGGGGWNRRGKNGNPKQKGSHSSFAPSNGGDVSMVSESYYGDSEFEMMDITVAVLGLSGLVCERKQSRFRSGKKKESGKPKRNGWDSNSLASSTDVSSGDDFDATPTTAVVSFSRNVSSSQTTILTHLPSIPLVQPTSVCGNVNTYTAMWPTESDSSIPEGSERRPSFTFNRLMMREALIQNSQESGMSMFVNEIIEFRVGISRGSEMIPLGVATLVISGEEPDGAQVLLQVQPFRHNKKGKVVEQKQYKVFNGAGKRGGKANPVSFASDDSRRYWLEEAALRILVRVTPKALNGENHDMAVQPSFGASMPYHIEVLPGLKDRLQRAGHGEGWNAGEGPSHSSSRLQRSAPSSLHLKEQLHSSAQTKTENPPNSSFPRQILCGNMCAFQPEEENNSTSFEQYGEEENDMPLSPVDPRPRRPRGRSRNVRPIQHYPKKQQEVSPIMYGSEAYGATSLFNSFSNEDETILGFGEDFENHDGTAPNYKYHHY